MDIRLFNIADTSAMIDLFRRSIFEVACEFYSADQLNVWAPVNIDPEKWVERCLSRRTWLAWDGDSLAGFTDLEVDGHLDMLFVSPDYQRQGVAQQLYDCVLAQAKHYKNETIFVEASLSARGFFEKQGFEVIEQQEIHRGGQVLVNFKMEKLL